MMQHPRLMEEIVRDRVERLRAEAARDRLASAAANGRARRARLSSAPGRIGSRLRSAMARIATTRV
ncbi:MAG TPA: hypothetical protein VLA90_06630, partial [Actinomycetota bacterium]|nr:hypothetical protein [Actinomycetota bacterium]